MSELEVDVRNYIAKAVAKNLPNEVLLPAIYEAIEPLLERIKELDDDNKELKNRIITLTDAK